jgi:TonB family protein
MTFGESPTKTIFAITDQVPPASRRRSINAAAVSAFIHLSCGAAIALLMGLSSSLSLPQMQQSLTLLVFTPPKVVPPPTPIAPLRAKGLEPLERPRPVEAQKQPAIRMAPLPVAKVVEAPPTQEIMHRRQPVMPEAAKPAPVRVATGVFPGTLLTARREEASRTVQSTGFEAPKAQAPQVKVSGPKVGAFEQVSSTNEPRPGSDRPVNAVASAGFGGPLAASPSRSASRSITDAGFGGSAAEPRSSSADQPRLEVQQSGFGETRPVQTQKSPAPRPQTLDTSVEILFKPRPTYTDEARSLKLEGDVILDVQFTAAGGVNVLGVVRGLGHGLDEAATHAAEQIRFKPAQSGGHPVDFRTTVHIVFRLA